MHALAPLAWPPAGPVGPARTYTYNQPAVPLRGKQMQEPAPADDRAVISVLVVIL
jgi:hypothetical protein